MSETCLEAFQALLGASDELQIIWSQIRDTFENANDATLAKVFVCPIFVEVKPTFHLVVEKVEVLFGKLFLNYFLVPAGRKGCESIDAKAVVIYSQGIV